MAEMRETKIRFGQRAWNLIQSEARADGVSASQFVREAAVARAVLARHERGETTTNDWINEIIRMLRED
jgi:uncharacterized protein (DUF1778 family)